MQLQHRKRWLGEQAVQFNRAAVLSVCFLRWRQRYTDKVHRVSIDATADRYYRTRVLAVAFSRWRWGMAESQRLAVLGAQADQHRRRTAAARALQAWKAWLSDLKDKRANIAAADSFAARSIAARALSRWAGAVDGAKLAAANRAVAAAHHAAGAVRKAWQQWRGVAAALQGKRAAAERARAAADLAVARRAFQTWRATFIASRQHAQAVAHHEAVQLRKSVGAFKACKVEAVRRNEAFSILEAEFSLGQDARRTRWAFQTWAAAKASAARAKAQAAAADAHHDKALLRRALRGWDAEARRSALKVRRCRQAAQFRKFHLTSAAFTHWKRTLLQRRIDDDKDCVALLFWSLRLKQKMLLGWRQHAALMKERAERRAAALEKRRQWLVRSAVEQWFKASATLSVQTSAATSEREQQHAVQLHARVRRFAERWRRIAAGGGGGGGGRRIRGGNDVGLAGSVSGGRDLIVRPCSNDVDGDAGSMRNGRPLPRQWNRESLPVTAVIEPRMQPRSGANRSSGRSSSVERSSSIERRTASPTALTAAAELPTRPAALEGPSLLECWVPRRRARLPPRRPRELMLDLAGSGTLGGVPVPVGMRSGMPGESSFVHPMVPSSSIEVANAADGEGGEISTRLPPPLRQAPSSSAVLGAGVVGLGWPQSPLPLLHRQGDGGGGEDDVNGEGGAVDGKTTPDFESTETAAAADVVVAVSVAIPNAAAAAAADVQQRLAKIQLTLKQYAESKAEQKELEADVQAAAANLAEASDNVAGSGDIESVAVEGEGALQETPRPTSIEAAAAELARLVSLKETACAAAAERRAAAVAAQEELRVLLAAE